MYLLGEQPAYADALINRLQHIPVRLLEGLMPCGPSLEFAAVDDLGVLLPGNQLFMLENGLLHGSIDDRALFYLHEGDLIGLRQGTELPRCRFRSDSPLALMPYLRSEFFQHIYADLERSELFLQYMTGQAVLLSDAVVRLKKPEFRSTNGFQRVAIGEVLIRQGDEPDQVFVLIDGHAEAFVDGHKVGDIPKDEIFGAMAVFTGEKRNASVITSEASTVMLIPKDQFLSLTQSNPKIAHSLIESMARRIDLLNEQIIQLSSLTPQAETQ
ncbi:MULTISPECIES: Crp/Fnr family transcriptional regulator [unclassified Pseudomonas]|uniref:Crp/Fnr family transcriptional regulator n=1 Tax=unclassified Pseudomonas TaxID=196821 RepID=UPI000C87DA9E|nr:MULTISPECIES: Crp/Fnr family transcriptional regulator [unclassified Pseudomonas]PMU08157.1 cAMP-binding protein [Pseudomonas sp. FW305-20]PMU14320.1 cAMP-binding protein [Pseudomonas sp. FW305-122]PMU39863.1 cAMP-binding protein [Pseudomonas sp. FW305-47B]PMX57571.1 cAMP-binding protein [Pseudomonas sp. FW305-33]PMX64327.1 cAMP-binding protein [Pseudomonas sp. FW305-60]